MSLFDYVQQVKRHEIEEIVPPPSSPPPTVEAGTPELVAEIVESALARDAAQVLTPDTHAGPVGEQLPSSPFAAMWVRARASTPLQDRQGVTLVVDSSGDHYPTTEEPPHPTLSPVREGEGDANATVAAVSDDGGIGRSAVPVVPGRDDYASHGADGHLETAEVAPVVAEEVPLGEIVADKLLAEGNLLSDAATVAGVAPAAVGLARWHEMSGDAPPPSEIRAVVPAAPSDHDAAYWRLTQTPAMVDLKVRVHEQLIRDLDPTQLAGDTSYQSPAWHGVARAAEERLLDLDGTVGRLERQQLGSEIADEILGLGPIEPLLRDHAVTEVMVNGADRVYFERGGVLYLASYAFRDNAHLLHTIDKILRPIDRRLDDSSPMVDARLADGSRVNAVIPPLAVHGPSMTIRKFSRELLSPEDLIRLGSMDRRTFEVLEACVRSRLNIVISGGTGTGKTTLLNLLSEFIPQRERLVTIEDPAELQIHHENWVSLETRPPNIEGNGEILQRDLVKNALRMRPDRIIVGECRAGEAFDMLQAMNTGHDGSLTTVHANSPRDALSRMENMVLMAGVDLPVQAIREQVAAGVNVLVHLTRMMDGSRRVTHIDEITGMQGNVISMHDIFLFKQSGIDPDGRVLGQLEPTGLRPHFMERLAQFGQSLDIEAFIPGPVQSALAPGSR